MNKKSKINKKIEVVSTTENLAKIRDFIKQTAEKSGFSDEVVSKIILAVDEACTNVIKHAYQYSSKGKMIIQVKSDSSKFSVSITDTGVGFNANAVPEPDMKSYFEEKKVGGLGIYLMKKLMDEVKYKSLNDRKNQVIMTKYLS